MKKLIDDSVNSISKDIDIFFWKMWTYSIGDGNDFIKYPTIEINERLLQRSKIIKEEQP